MKCLFCGEELIWSQDFNCSEISEEYEEDDTAVASYYLCPKCGRDYQIMEPTKEDKENEYKEYWNNEDNNQGR